MPDEAWPISELMCLGGRKRCMGTFGARWMLGGARQWSGVALVKPARSTLRATLTRVHGACVCRVSHNAKTCFHYLKS